MGNPCALRFFRSAIFFAAAFSVAAPVGAAAESNGLLTGKAAMGDWKSDAPGVRRKITVADLPPPGSNILAINRARVVDRPAGVPLRVPPVLKSNFTRKDFVTRAFCLLLRTATSLSLRVAQIKSRCCAMPTATVTRI
jgi:hypothetical protein